MSNSFLYWITCYFKYFSSFLLFMLLWIVNHLKRQCQISMFKTWLAFLVISSDNIHWIIFMCAKMYKYFKILHTWTICVTGKEYCITPLWSWCSKLQIKHNYQTDLNNKKKVLDTPSKGIFRRVGKTSMLIE